MNEAVNLKGDAMIVMTRAEYHTLVEDIGDAAIADQALTGDKDAPTMPSDLAKAMWSGDLHPLSAWRQSVGLSEAALSQASNVPEATIAEIEAGDLDPRVSTVRALAVALNLGIEDIVG